MNILSDLDEFLSGTDTETGNSQESGGQIRQKLEQALAHLRTLKAENDKLQAAQAEAAVSGTWEKLGVPAFVRGLYNGEKTTEAITKWWEDSKGFFNLDAAGTQPEVTPEEQARNAQLAAVQQASSLGSDAGTQGFEAAFAKAQEVKGSGRPDKAKLAEFYKAAGIATY